MKKTATPTNDKSTVREALHPALPSLVGDIGGTNARFQIVTDRTSPPISFETVQTADFENIEAAIAKAVLSKTDIRPKSAILAAAGPITANGLNLTNCHWNIVPDGFLKSGVAGELLLMNDFEAQALSLPFLEQADLKPIGGGNALFPNDQTKAVLGPGTGLGVGLLVRAGDLWVPVAGEGGHVDLGPRTERERLIWDHLETADGRVSGEQILCGSGLDNLYRAICMASGATPVLKGPAAISAAAMDGSNGLAEEALTLFCTMLGRVAGDLALTAMARGGVYIAGGIAQKILPFLIESPFREAFVDKAPHRRLVEQMATSVVVHPLPALLGLAAYARRPQGFAVDIEHRFWRVS